MPKRHSKRPRSKAQARLFGAAAGGKVPGFPRKSARDRLRGIKLKRLPARVKRKGTRRKR